MSGEKDKATRRVESTQSRLVVELTETRAQLRTLIRHGKDVLPRIPHGHREDFLDALLKAETFLGAVLVLIVPSLLLQ